MRLYVCVGGGGGRGVRKTVPWATTPPHRDRRAPAPPPPPPPPPPRAPLRRVLGNRELDPVFLCAGCHARAGARATAQAQEDADARLLAHCGTPPPPLRAAVPGGGVAARCHAPNWLGGLAVSSRRRMENPVCLRARGAHSLSCPPTSPRRTPWFKQCARTLLLQRAWPITFPRRAQDSPASGRARSTPRGRCPASSSHGRHAVHAHRGGGGRWRGPVARAESAVRALGWRSGGALAGGGVHACAGRQGGRHAHMRAAAPQPCDARPSRTRAGPSPSWAPTQGPGEGGARGCTAVRARRVGDHTSPPALRRCGHTLTTIQGPEGDLGSSKLVLFGKAAGLSSAHGRRRRAALEGATLVLGNSCCLLAQLVLLLLLLRAGGATALEGQSKGDAPPSPGPSSAGGWAAGGGGWGGSAAAATRSSGCGKTHSRLAQCWATWVLQAPFCHQLAASHRPPAPGRPPPSTPPHPPVHQASAWLAPPTTCTSWTCARGSGRR